MTQQEKIAALLAMHKPEAQENNHVCEVWHDGEITSTKGADLYGVRNLHQVTPPLMNSASHLPVRSLHARYTGSRIMVNTHAEAVAARKIIGSDYLDE